MAYRLTDTNKWSDKWFLDLRPIEKLLFNYLCDNCDCAGFIEKNIKKWSNEIGNNNKDIEGALKGLGRGLIYSNDNENIYLRTFLKHQKHFPLNPKDNIYKGILSRFENYKYKFDIQEINVFIEGALKGLGRDNNNGNGKDNDIDKSKYIITWREDFELYKKELRIAYDNLVNDENYILERQKFHPGLNIRKSLNKSCVDYWAKESGWKKKKSSKTIIIDWKETLNKALTYKMNQVWKTKDELNGTR
jgi:hypothetical protein